MKILLASSEIVPFAKTGGLADVCGALPQAINQLGHEITLFMPAYRDVHRAEQPIENTGISFEIPLGHQVVHGQLLKTTLPNSNIDVYLISHDEFFDRAGLYGENGEDYQDNCQRFTFFSRGVLESIRLLGLKPDIIHTNDWQTALIPALLKCEYAENPDYRNIATLITVHNLAYQGLFDRNQLVITGLDPKYFNWQQMEFYGQLNFLKTGLVFADAINTVSPTYALEIQTDDQGYGLQGVLQSRADRLSGIINGIDSSQWDPRTDQHLAQNYGPDFEPAQGCLGKAKCKSALQAETQLTIDPEIPLIGIVGRLASQKGWSLILPVLKNWLANIDAQWIILGTGDPDYHHVLTSLHRSYPHKLALTLGFSNEFAHRIESGADMFLMPSQYEPCGLNQMYSMAYGTIPIVRNTGGLADTVVDATPQTIANQTATGFRFDDFSADALQQTMDRAIKLFRSDRKTWNQMMLTAMKSDWSWSASANQYVELYRRIITGQ